MLRRRFLINQILSGDKDGIITDGLILHLKGTDKGTNPLAWTDKISGREFIYNDCKVLSNGVEFNGETSYASFSNKENLYLYYETGTIELVVNATAQQNCVIVSPTGNQKPNQFSAGFYGGKMIICNNSKGMQILPINSKNNYTFSSIGDGGSYCNLQKCESASSDLWGGTITQFIAIGARLRPNACEFFKGTLHEIRYYNRKLTEKEILQNQQHDMITYFGGGING